MIRLMLIIGGYLLIGLVIDVGLLMSDYIDRKNGSLLGTLFSREYYSMSIIRKILIHMALIPFLPIACMMYAIERIKIKKLFRRS